MMKFSFQTFCLVFLVTVVHLILITVFAPFSDRAGEYFAGLEVEEMLEQGRADLAALMQEDLEKPSPDDRSDGETAGPSSSPDARAEEKSEKGEKWEGLPEDREAVALLRRDRNEVAAISAEEATAKPAAPALMDPRLLARRIARPEPESITVAEPVRSDSGSAVAANPNSADVAIAQDSSVKPKTEPASGGIREIRPIPRL